MLACALALLATFVRADALQLAEEAYRRGDYAAARGSYIAWLDENDDGRVEYNLGNCEFRLGDYARALWRYERARRRLGNREDIAFNRSLALRKLGRSSGDEGGFAAGLEARMRGFEAADWFWLALPLEVVGLALLAFSLRGRRLALVVLSGVLVLHGIGGFVMALSVDPDRVLGVVVLEEGSALRAEPRAELDAVLMLGAGVPAQYVAGSSDWVKVRVRGRVGWVERERVGLW